MSIRNNTITVNLDRHPGDAQALRSIALTLTEFSTVSHVQIEVNGNPVTFNGETGPIIRPVLNSDNPQGLPLDYSSGTRFLPLYFLDANGNYVRITRLVPRTSEIAQKTVMELLAGPGSYSNLLSSPIPGGTELRGIKKASADRVVVDLTKPFTTASNRAAAVNTLVLSLTELRDTDGRPIFRQVEILVESQKLAEFWGNKYDRVFDRPPLNPQ
jgi:germination protein M